MAKTNAEKQADHRRKMKEQGYTARLIWVKKGEPTPAASPIGNDRPAQTDASALHDAQGSSAYEVLAAELEKTKAALSLSIAGAKNAYTQQRDTERLAVEKTATLAGAVLLGTESDRHIKDIYQLFDVTEDKAAQYVNRRILARLRKARAFKTF